MTKDKSMQQSKDKDNAYTIDQIHGIKCGHEETKKKRKKKQKKKNRATSWYKNGGVSCVYVY